MSAGSSLESPVVYSRRWYILMIFSFHAMFQCTVWNTWVGSRILKKFNFIKRNLGKFGEKASLMFQGPVESVALKVFPAWTTADISNFANWGKAKSL